RAADRVRDLARGQTLTLRDMVIVTRNTAGEVELDQSVNLIASGALGGAALGAAIGFVLGIDGGLVRPVGATLRPAALAILGLSLGGPASERAADILAVTADPINTKILKYIKELRPRASKQVVRWVKGHGQLQDLLERLNAQVGFRQLTAAAAAAQFFANSRRVLR
ncbi:hypothetical protein J8J27_20945, partial [Mycobacterium tuberculosis]|nr:hypothetical protein [Mycobacterium tuberculosis]